MRKRSLTITVKPCLFCQTDISFHHGKYTGRRNVSQTCPVCKTQHLYFVRKDEFHLTALGKKFKVGNTNWYLWHDVTNNYTRFKKIKKHGIPLEEVSITEEYQYEGLISFDKFKSLAVFL